MTNETNQKKDLFNIFDRISHFREKKFKFVDCK